MNALLPNHPLLVQFVIKVCVGVAVTIPTVWIFARHNRGQIRRDVRGRPVLPWYIVPCVVILSLVIADGLIRR